MVFREVPLNSLEAPSLWREFTVAHPHGGGIRRSTTTAHDLDIEPRTPSHGSGFVYENPDNNPLIDGRFISWRAKGDVLELSEHSLNLNLHANAIRLHLPGIILPRVVVYECTDGNVKQIHVMVLTTTGSVSSRACLADEDHHHQSRHDAHAQGPPDFTGDAWTFDASDIGQHCLHRFVFKHATSLARKVSDSDAYPSIFASTSNDSLRNERNHRVGVCTHSPPSVVDMVHVDIAMIGCADGSVSCVEFNGHGTAERIFKEASVTQRLLSSILPSPFRPVEAGQNVHDLVAVVGDDGPAFLVVLGGDGKVRVWNHTTGRLELSFDATTDVQSDDGVIGADTKGKPRETVQRRLLLIEGIYNENDDDMGGDHDPPPTAKLIIYTGSPSTDCTFNVYTIHAFDSYRPSTSREDSASSSSLISIEPETTMVFPRGHTSSPPLLVDLAYARHRLWTLWRVSSSTDNDDSDDGEVYVSVGGESFSTRSITGVNYVAWSAPMCAPSRVSQVFESNVWTPVYLENVASVLSDSLSAVAAGGEYGPQSGGISHDVHLDTLLHPNRISRLVLQRALTIFTGDSRPAPAEGIIGRDISRQEVIRAVQDEVLLACVGAQPGDAADISAAAWARFTRCVALCWRRYAAPVGLVLGAEGEEETGNCFLGMVRSDSVSLIRACDPLEAALLATSYPPSHTQPSPSVCALPLHSSAAVRAGVAPVDAERRGYGSSLSIDAVKLAQIAFSQSCSITSSLSSFLPSPIASDPSDRSVLTRKRRRRKAFDSLASLAHGTPDMIRVLGLGAALANSVGPGMLQAFETETSSFTDSVEAAMSPLVAAMLSGEVSMPVSESSLILHAISRIHPIGAAHVLLSLLEGKGDAAGSPSSSTDPRVTSSSGWFVRTIAAGSAGRQLLRCRFELARNLLFLLMVTAEIRRTHRGSNSSTRAMRKNEEEDVELESGLIFRAVTLLRAARVSLWLSTQPARYQLPSKGANHTRSGKRHKLNLDQFSALHITSSSSSSSSSSPVSPVPFFAMGGVGLLELYIASCLSPSTFASLHDTSAQQDGTQQDHSSSSQALSHFHDPVAHVGVYCRDVHALALSVVDALSFRVTDLHRTIVPFCVFLEERGQHLTLMQLLHLTPNKPPSLLHLLGLCQLSLGRYERARDCFIQAASSADMDSTEDDSSIFLDDVWQPTFGGGPTSSTGNVNRRNQYFVSVMQLFEERHQFEAAVAVARYAIGCVGQDNDDQPYVALLWTRRFKLCLELAHYDEAYVAMMSNPNSAHQENALRRLLVVLCERNEIATLCDLPFVGLADDVAKILHAKSRTSDVLQRPNYYEVLHSFHVRRGNYRKGGEIMYEYAERLGDEGVAAHVTRTRDGGGGPCGDDDDVPRSGLDVLRRQADSYLACASCFHLLDPRFAWVLEKRQSYDGHAGDADDDDDDDSAMRGVAGTHLFPPPSPKRKLGQFLSGGGVGNDDNNDDDDDEEFPTRQPTSSMAVVRLRDIEQKYALTLAHVRFCELQNVEYPSPLGPDDTVSLLIHAGMYDDAISLALDLDTSSSSTAGTSGCSRYSVRVVQALGRVFESLTDRCLELQLNDGNSSDDNGDDADHNNRYFLSLLTDIDLSRGNGVGVGGGGADSNDQASAAWRLLQSYVEKFDSRHTNFSFALSTADRILSTDRGLRLPSWLLSLLRKGNSQGLLRLLLAHNLLEEACCEVIDMVARSSRELRGSDRQMVTHVSFPLIDQLRRQIRCVDGASNNLLRLGGEVESVTVKYLASQ
eukprot:TRINITY_DN531_c0_g1_i1.p1 TRINITY_DN531_c0_g1~~TRINITY_DN531_c0_g1_i1.p1  ORF type:complete len:1764 (+),score=372.22 TRINITY_DN531_c0_g1_i1:203-5494(+)